MKHTSAILLIYSHLLAILSMTKMSWLTLKITTRSLFVWARRAVSNLSIISFSKVTSVLSALLDSMNLSWVGGISHHTQVCGKFSHFTLYSNYYYLQFSHIIKCILIVRQQLPTILYSRRLLKWTWINHYNSVTCMLIAYTTSLVSYIGQPISMVDRQEVCTSLLDYYFLT